MNPHRHRQRIHFLNLKLSMGTITPEERSELDHLASIRVFEVTGGVVFVTPHEESMAEWISKIDERNAAECERREREKSDDAPSV